MSNPAELLIHPRALIRHAIVRLLKEASATAAQLGDRIYPNREEHWLADNLPAAGVYTLREEHLETDRHPDPDERRIHLVVELLARLSTGVDDKLDALCLATEQVLCLDDIGRAMGEILDALLVAQGGEPLPLNADGRHPADTLIQLSARETEIGIASEGNRNIGVAALTYELDYAPMRLPGTLDDWLLAITDYDLVTPSHSDGDGTVEMTARVDFPAPEQTEP